jgi:carboxypeptidase C (cathepsin A)
MKKITFLAAAIALIGMTSVDANAQTATDAQQQTPTTQQQDNKEKVTQEQLPEPVKTALTSDTYKDWTVGDIYKVAPAEGQADAKVVYEVTMTNAQGQTGALRLDEEGKDASVEQ